MVVCVAAEDAEQSLDPAREAGETVWRSGTDRRGEGEPWCGVSSVSAGCQNPADGADFRARQQLAGDSRSGRQRRITRRHRCRHQQPARRSRLGTGAASRRSRAGTGSQKFRRPAGFEAALIEWIDRHQPDLVILAGFMRVLTAGFTEHYRGRLLNIHPSLLPKFRGLHTHERAIAAGETEHGATIHFVTAELDGGPVIVQARVPGATGR
jgi:hypothetical protein